MESRLALQGLGLVEAVFLCHGLLFLLGYFYGQPEKRSKKRHCVWEAAIQVCSLRPSLANTLTFFGRQSRALAGNSNGHLAESKPWGKDEEAQQMPTALVQAFVSPSLRNALLSAHQLVCIERFLFRKSSHPGTDPRSMVRRAQDRRGTVPRRQSHGRT